MVGEAVEEEEIVSEKAISRKRPLDDNQEVLTSTDVVSVVENEVLDASVEVDTTLQPSMIGVFQPDVETVKTTGIVTSAHKESTEIENRLQKRPNIEKSSPVRKLPEEGGLSGHDQMISMPSIIILGDQLEVGNSDKVNGIENTDKDLNTDTHITTTISISDNCGEGETHLISHSTPLRAPIGHFRRKLLVLDINGLLADIVSPPPRDYKADTYIARRAIFKRPFFLDFMKFCFEKFDVGIWSSRTKINVERVIDYLFGNMKDKLLFCWDSTHCTPSEFYTLENNHKTLVFKELRKIWDKHDSDLPWERGYYNETNTLLLDDSPYKALLNPPYTAIFPHSYSYMDENDNSLGRGGDLRAYLEGLARAENVPDYVEQHEFGQSTITETDPSWDFYVKAVGSAPPLSPSK